MNQALKKKKRAQVSQRNRGGSKHGAGQVTSGAKRESTTGRSTLRRRWRQRHKENDEQRKEPQSQARGASTSLLEVEVGAEVQVTETEKELRTPRMSRNSESAP